MSNATAVEGVQFLTQSTVRVHILELLYETGGLRKCELRDRVDASRVTVRRNIDALEDRDLVAVAGGRRELTILGEIVVEDVLPAFDTAGTVERLRPFVRWFPENDLGFDVRSLADATVIVSDSTNPYAPVNRHFEAVQTADRIRCLLPTVGLYPLSAVRDRVVETDRRHEIVIDETVASTLSTETSYEQVVADLVAAENCTLSVTPRELAYYLGLCDNSVQICVGGEDGLPRVLVETDADDVREWADKTYEQCRRRAEPLTLSAPHE